MDAPHTFLSYSREDSAFVVRLASDLRAKGAHVWLDQFDIPIGERWDNSIENALRGASRMIVVLSPTSVASPNVLDEVSFALEKGKTVLPVLSEACEIPFRLRRLQYVDFTSDYDGALHRLLAALGTVPRPENQTAMKTPPAPTAEEVPAVVPQQPPVVPSSIPGTDALPGSPRSSLRPTGPIVASAAAVVLLLSWLIFRSSSTNHETSPPVKPETTTLRGTEGVVPIPPAPAAVNPEPTHPETIPDTSNKRADKPQTRQPKDDTVRARPASARATSSASGPFHVGRDIKEPTKIKNVNPIYPPEAIHAHVTGVVIIEATIGRDGSVRGAKILRSIPLLDDAALDAVKQWQFTPSLLNGQPVEVIMTVTVNFTLQNNVMGP